MSEFDIRGDSLDVQDLMAQIRARLQEKRGVDYTEQQVRDVAAVKLERFLDPAAVRSDLLAQFRETRPRQLFVPFGPDPLFTAQRPIVARVRNMLRRVLRLFCNPDPITESFARINRLADLSVADRDQYFELLHNLVVELTRAQIELRNLKMRVESLTSRLDFDERRARALENVVVYRAERPDPAAGGEPAPPGEGPGQRSRRIRRRRWRRNRPSATAIMGGTNPADAPDREDKS